MAQRTEHSSTTPTASPWIDLDPGGRLQVPPPAAPVRDHRLASGLAVAGTYAGFSTWAYFAWYRDHANKARREIGGDGLFGRGTYAGGADKLGHAWATMVLARGGTAALRAGGWQRTRSAIVSALLSESLFFAVEVKDYYYFEFSPGDFAFNTLGALAAIAFDTWPRLDELLDYRVEYWPSDQYRYNLTNSDSPCTKREPGRPSCSRWNVAEDYSGETYLIALHLGAVHGLRDLRWGSWSRYVDVDVGFRARNYKPPPTLEHMAVLRTQTLFFGISLNAQAIIDRLLPTTSTLRKVGHGVFEVVTPPLTLPVLGVERGTRTVQSGGA